MGALLSSPIVQAVFTFLANWLWSKLRAEFKEMIAEKEINARVQAKVKDVLDQYEKIILEFDELKDAGKLTEADKERIRNEKIKLEESLLNSVTR